MLFEPVICLNNNIFVINSKYFTMDGNQRCRKDHEDADRSILIYYYMYISALVGAWYNNFMLVLILYCQNYNNVMSSQ